MLRRNLAQASSWRSRPVCVFCATRSQVQPFQTRSFATTDPLLGRTAKQFNELRRIRKQNAKKAQFGKEGPGEAQAGGAESTPQQDVEGVGNAVDGSGASTKGLSSKTKKQLSARLTKRRKNVGEAAAAGEQPTQKAERREKALSKAERKAESRERKDESKSLKEALTGGESFEEAARTRKERIRQLEIQILNSDDLTFEAVEVDKPAVPKLAYGLDRVLFNPGVYRLQDPRSRIYNFDPYLERIMPVNEFDFDALSEYKTSSKDQDLLDLTKRVGTKFTGSTSSMSSILQHFHYLLSNFRPLNHDMLSRSFPDPSKNFSKVTLAASAVFLRYKDGIYAIDADKTHDGPNIMSWLGHSLEKLLTTDRKEFELYRRSSPDKAPEEDNASRCYHYSKQGNILMRSQLDAQDPRLPGTGVFDLKTRAVVSIRMNHREYESGSGYQLRYGQGEWESYEREFYDMSRATMLKYSMQVRMGRMDGIFLAYHNIERIFGFQYLSLSDMDQVLHGQADTSLGDQEFKLSVGLLDDLLSRAIKQFPETSIRLHVETRGAKTPFMYIFAEPVTEEQADEMQRTGEASQKEFARRVVGIGKDNPEVQEAWQNVQSEVDEQVNSDNKTPDDMAENEGPISIDNADTQEPSRTPQESEPTPEESKSTPDKKPEGPLIGWTLTIRNKVNGSYVDQPRDFTKDDDWLVEYHAQEIPEGSRWRLYDSVRARRDNLYEALNSGEVDDGLKRYRESIQHISNRGRKWRTQQDRLNDQLGVQVYRPMGPGSEGVVEVEESAPKKGRGGQAEAIEEVFRQAQLMKEDLRVEEVAEEKPGFEEVTEERPEVEELKHQEAKVEEPKVEETKNEELATEEPKFDDTNKEDAVSEPPKEKKSWFGF